MRELFNKGIFFIFERIMQKLNGHNELFSNVKY